MRSVFLAPHPDDETLFGAFTLLRHDPFVICVLDPSDQGRRGEFARAMRVLGVTAHTIWPFPETAPDWARIATCVRGLAADHLYAPAYSDSGNSHHNEVALAARAAQATVTNYLTYTPASKQVDGREVEYEREWIGLKLRALACYESQFSHPSHAPHFLRDQREFYV